MNKFLKCLGVMLLVILSLLDFAHAKDSYSFPVSCVIPAVPGKNAPSFEEAAQNDTAAPAEKNKNLYWVQEETVREENGKIVIVKTAYPR